MNAILRKIEKKEIQKKDSKQKFEILEFTCDVKINEKGDIKTLRGKYGIEFARKYFEYCGVKTRDVVGKKVDVSIAKRTYETSEGEERTISYIRFMNVLNEKGEPIIMPKEENSIDF